MRILLVLLTLHISLSSDAKVIGKDERVLAGAEQARLVSAIGMIVCAREVNGEMMSIKSTGTLVGDRRTLVASAHGFFIRDDNGNREYRFDEKRDCIFRRYTELMDEKGNRKYIAYKIIGSAFGEHINSEENLEDWSVLRLDRPVVNARSLPTNTLNMEAMKPTSRIPIEIIGITTIQTLLVCPTTQKAQCNLLRTHAAWMCLGIQPIRRAVPLVVPLFTERLMGASQLSRFTLGSSVRRI